MASLDEQVTKSAATAVNEASRISATESRNRSIQSPDSTSRSIEEMPHKSHQRLVFTDPVAFRYLEEDPSTTVLHRRTTLSGYEIYVVEQWACSRIHPTFIITAFTGDPSHTVVVGVLSVPTDEHTWSPRLKLYFNAVKQNHAQRKETPLGTLLVTNLSAFPSALTVIPVPEGDVRRHREDFIVNEDLKRLGCSGRAGLKLQYPSAVVEDKFHQLYRTSERVPLYHAVLELVRECQIALTIFDKLAPEYVDGLLCDVTERAISDWWTDIGTDLYNVEPSDGILGPVTVSALLGTLMGARNRLHAYGTPAPKDAFDVSALKKAIAHFQKSQKIHRSRRLDRETLYRLHRATTKAASSDRWTGAVKSTVAELGGKGGEMVMGMVGGRDKGNIADIETLDLERFIQFMNSDRSRWLWQGKSRKGNLSVDFDTDQMAEDMVFTKNHQGNYVWTSRKRASRSENPMDRVVADKERPTQTNNATDPSDERGSEPVKTVSKTLTNRVSDARAGLGRFKDAVGLQNRRPHQNYKPSRDAADLDHDLTYHSTVLSDDEKPTSRAAKAQEAAKLPASESTKESDSEFKARESSALNHTATNVPEIMISPTQRPTSPTYEVPEISQLRVPEEKGESRDLEHSKSRSSSIAPDDEQIEIVGLGSLRRAQTYPDPYVEHSFFDGRWPRHLSFSAVEEVVLPWKGLSSPKIDIDQQTGEDDLSLAIAREDVLFSDAQIFDFRVLQLSRGTVPWVEQQLESVESLHRNAQAMHEGLSFSYPESFEKYQSLQEKSTQLLTDESSRLTEEVKHVELLGAKLDYELNVLESKVEDVEDGLHDFERHVDQLELRMQNLLKGEQKKDHSWFSWFQRGLKRE